MELVLGIDLGTTNFKACVFGRDGRLRGLGRVSVDVPVSGPRCELPVERFWRLLREAVGAALRSAGAEAEEIRAAAYSSQANSFLLLGDGDEPLTPILLWPDRRDETVDPALASLWSRPDFLRTTGLGLGPSPEFAAAKIIHFRQRQPELWARVRRVMTISDYLVHSLTSLPVGDAGTGELLGMQDVRGRSWWPAALEAAGVTRAMLSEPRRPGALAGAMTATGAGRLGLPAGIPLALGGLDHHVAAVGAGLGNLADVSESIGTVTACVRDASAYLPRSECVVGPGLAGGLFYELAFDENGTGVLDWYRREHAPQLTIPDLLRLAEETPGAAGLEAVPLAHRHVGLEGFRGRSAAHGHGHFVRAILESTARTTGKLLDRLCGGDRPKRIVATGGGARSDFWLQLQADLLRAEIVRVSCEEPACQGAALLAAVAAGWFGGVNAASAAWVREEKVFRPR